MLNYGICSGEMLNLVKILFYKERSLCLKNIRSCYGIMNRVYVNGLGCLLANSDSVMCLSPLFC